MKIITWIPTLLLAPSIALAAPEDRGLRGLYVGGGPAFSLGTATDEDGGDAGSYWGGGFRLRVGEEIIPRFGLGLELVSLSAGAQSGDYTASVGGFFLQATWRPTERFEPLVLTAGTGLGVAQLTPEGDDGLEGANGGAFFQLGVTYELSLTGTDDSGLALAPGVFWYRVNATDANELGTDTVVVALDLLWYAGR